MQEQECLSWNEREMKCEFFRPQSEFRRAHCWFSIKTSFRVGGASLISSLQLWVADTWRVNTQVLIQASHWSSLNCSANLRRPNIMLLNEVLSALYLGTLGYTDVPGTTRLISHYIRLSQKEVYKNTTSPLKLHKWLIKPKTAEHYSVVCRKISLVWPGTTVQPRVLYPIMQWSYCARIQTVSLLLSDSPAALLSSYPASSTKWTQPLMTRKSWDSNSGPLDDSDQSARGLKVLKQFFILLESQQTPFSSIHSSSFPLNIERPILQSPTFTGMV